MTSTTTDLVNIADNTKTIPTLTNKTGGYTDTDFSVNSWGYKQDSNNYNDFKLSQTILENNDRTNADTTTLTFATKIDYLKESGTYKNTITFSAVANPLVYHMQNLDVTLCTSTPAPAIDERDGQEYIIQRLADGKCWMMTNLNLGATTLTKDLTSENTNIATTVAATTFNGWKQTTPTITYAQAVYSTITDSNSDTGSDTDSVSGTKYGTLYNFCALTVGDSRACVSTTTGYTSSFYNLCPAGWKIPALDEFSTLYDYYSTFAKMRSSITDDGAAFTLNGWFGESSGGISGQGTYGSFWSSTPSNVSGRGNYYLRLDTYNSGQHVYATPSTSNYWYANNGRAIRCILEES